MLTTLDLIIYGFVAVVVLPLAISSIISGSRPPANSFITKYYHAEPRLMLAGNLFLVAVCATAIQKLATHFGYIDAALSDSLTTWISVPFLIFLVIFLVLFVKAILKVRREGKTV